MNDEKKPTPIRPRDTANDAEFAPLVSFDGRPTECGACGSREFVLGFEAGLLHARLEARPPEFRGTYHTANSEMLRREAEAMGYDVALKSSGDAAWVYATFAKRVPRRRLGIVPKEGT